MCGIAGLVDFNAPPSKRLLGRMSDTLARRGPDAAGVWSDEACGLAHRRLSIIDLSGSSQPMLAPGCPMALSYNGELYNYRQLRADLRQQGQSFATDGDTEVVLRCVARGWAGALAQFDGMFAFAAWDPANERLLLARDPIGEKPLFYATPRPGLLVFGSEPKALLCHPEVDRRLNEAALRQVLRFRAVYGEACLHAGIVQLPPGSFLEFDRQGARIGAFFELTAELAESRPQLRNLSDDQIVAHGRRLFMESVEERLIADVPVGAFLSGGLDSSLITAAMRQLLGAHAEIRTFSVGFEGDQHTELPFAAQVADWVKSKHTAITVGPQTFIERLSELSECRDGPVSEPADVAVAQMARIAREHVRVALSGEGADEIFAGYPKYGLARAGALASLPLRIVGDDRTARWAGRLGLAQARALVAARALAQPTELERISQWFSYLDRRELCALFPRLGWGDAEWLATMSSQAAVLTEGRRGGALERMQLVDCVTWLPGNMLERGDRMTMAEGLEMRPPFLDKELVKFGLAIPSRLKIRYGTGKWIARQWGKEMLPPAIASRRKWGFRVPLAAWFRGPLREMLHDYLARQSGLSATFGDAGKVEQMLDQHDRGTGDFSASLWGLFAAEVWYQDVYLPRVGEVADKDGERQDHALAGA